MTNHVFNYVSAQGSAEGITAFKNKALRLRTEQSEKPEFSYWNFITPPQEAIDSGEYWETNGFKAGVEFGNTPNNWYHFNTREWGTKWDAYDIQDTITLEPEIEFDTSFSSAWSPPLPVFEAMTRQHPDIIFSFSWEEEGGWGGEASGKFGVFTIDKQWDVPNSHADHVERDKECYCQWDDDSKSWYDDCPAKIELLANKEVANA